MDYLKIYVEIVFMLKLIRFRKKNGCVKLVFKNFFDYMCRIIGVLLIFILYVDF